MHTEWQLLLLWGVLVGAGTGVTSMVLAAVVATRWFDQRRGVVLGALSAANATGQLVFLPMLAGVVETSGWRTRGADRRRGRRAWSSSIVFLFMRDRPGDIGLRPYGQARRRRAGARAAGRWRRSRRWRTPRAPGRSGCSPARSSSAARAPTA